MIEWPLEVVTIPVRDVDRAKRFYAEQLGFTVDLDHQVSETVRIVQLTPVGSGCSIQIGTGDGEAPMPPGAIQGLLLVVNDIEATRAALVAHGIAVGPIVHYEGGSQRAGKGGPWNAVMSFADPDGNGWGVQERPASA